mmetsp:Transcript_55163/g.134041  ORF Transcript_55163/g.134041 Transcript_55163/m.134041 type:complete len:91 (-) Transcript_55163:669-941(-)
MRPMFPGDILLWQVEGMEVLLATRCIFMISRQLNDIIPTRQRLLKLCVSQNNFSSQQLLCLLIYSLSFSIDAEYVSVGLAEFLKMLGFCS